MSGYLGTRKLIEKGIKVGLGSDLAGGYSPSFLESIRHAIAASTVVYRTGDKSSLPLNAKEAFWLATVGKNLDMK